MFGRKLIKNKIYALVLIGIGVLSFLPENDATAFAFTCLIGVPLFFAKENWIIDGGRSHGNKKIEGKNIRSISNHGREKSHGYGNSKAACGVRYQTR